MTIISCLSLNLNASGNQNNPVKINKNNDKSITYGLMFIVCPFCITEIAKKRTKESKIKENKEPSIHIKRGLASQEN